MVVVDVVKQMIGRVFIDVADVLSIKCVVCSFHHKATAVVAAHTVHDGRHVVENVVAEHVDGKQEVGPTDVVGFFAEGKVVIGDAASLVFGD